jgi:hypothetical protein
VSEGCCQFRRHGWQQDFRRKGPWYPNLSLFARKLTIFGYWRILLQKSAVTDDVVQRIHLDDGVLSRDPDARYAIPDIAVWRTSPFYRTTALRQKPPVAKPLDKTSDLVRKGQNLPANV